MQFHRRLMLCLCVLSLLSITAYAHSGGTDSQGGHYNHSTGEYHFHHGQSAHDHYDMDGDGDLDCPYDFNEKPGINSSNSNESTIPIQTDPAEEKSSPGIGGKIFLSIFFLFPVSLLPVGLVFWLLHFILDRFQIEISKKADAVLFWTLYTAVNIFSFYLIISW